MLVFRVSKWRNCWRS